LPKNNDYEFFYYFIQTKVLRNESNLIESFKLHYLVQTHVYDLTMLIASQNS